MRRLLAAILGVAVTPQPATGRDATPNIVVEAVTDLSDGDPAAIDAARRALRAGPSEDGLFAHMTGEMREFAIIADSLEGTGRLISLDWKEDLSEARAKFTALFAKSGIDPDDALARIDRGADAIVESGVGLAYAAFRVTADATGMRIVDLDADADMYHFALVPSERAERWIGVRVGPNQFIADGDRHFLDTLEAMGLSPRSTAHPSRTERPRPVVSNKPR